MPEEPYAVQHTAVVGGGGRGARGLRALRAGFFLTERRGSITHTGRQMEPRRAKQHTCPPAEGRPAQAACEGTGRGGSPGGLEGVGTAGDGNDAGSRFQPGQEREGAAQSSARAGASPLHALRGKR